MHYPEKWPCPNCKNIVIDSKTCKFCGFKFSLYYPEIWDCPNCQKFVERSASCLKCGYPKNIEYPKLWHCTQCGKLVKMQGKCPNCAAKKALKRAPVSDLNNFLKVAVPSYLLILVLLVISFSFLTRLYLNHNITPTNKTYTFGSATITLPLWTVVRNSNSSIFLRNSTLLQDLNIFVNEPYYALLSDELYRLYTEIGQQVSAVISEEYERNNWSVLCFNSSMFKSCIAVTRCNSSNVFVQTVAFNGLNKDYLYSAMDSLIC